MLLLLYGEAIMQFTPKEETMTPLERKAWAEKTLRTMYKRLLPEYPGVRITILFDYAIVVDYGLGNVRRIEPAA